MGAAQLDLIVGGDGSDTVHGGAANDTLFGDAGNDRLEGGQASDAYFFSAGDGQDTIEDNADGRTSNDTLLIHGYAPADVTVTRASPTSADVVLTFDGTSDSITIINTLGEYFEDSIESIVFDDTTVWTMAYLRSLVLSASTTGGNDSITGFATADVLAGGAGNDTLKALDGNDTLSGDVGNDRFEGGPNSDTYVFNAGDGQDTIEDNANGLTSNDTLIIHGYAPADVTVTRGSPTSADVVLTFGGTSDSIAIINTLDDHFADSIEIIVFDDSTVWATSHLRSVILAASQTSGNDSIAGFAVADLIGGGAGNDTISGAGGNDRLVGGTDDDRLTGGAGADTLGFATGFGDDTITDFQAGSGATDRIELSLGQDFDTFTEVLAVTSQVGSNAVILFGNGDQITMQGLQMNALVADDFSFV